MHSIPPLVSTAGKETLRLIRDNSRDTVSPPTLKALCSPFVIRFFDELSELLRESSDVYHNKCVGIKLITLYSISRL
jgi:hypothetical protein